jgi:ketosteroid isomerase-like protein
MTVTNADAETVRRLYTATNAGDIDTVLACLAPDGVWHLPGKSVLAGDHRSLPAVLEVFAKLAALSGQTLQTELLDVAVGQNFVVAVQRATATYQGRNLDVTGCQLIRLEEGRIAEVWGHYFDQYALDAFFRTT